MAISPQRHKELMDLAISEMRKSKSEHPDRADPQVGAVLVDADGKVIAVAHRGELRVGDHAEFTLIERKCLDLSLDGLILYTTLEPCVKRNAPKRGCTKRVINARLAKVVIGHQDPDPSVAGNGEKLLREAGIQIAYFEKEFEEIIASENKRYFKEKEDLAKQLIQDEISAPNQQ